MLHSGLRPKDTLPEWSKGVDSSSTSASCVGSNPTGVIWRLFGEMNQMALKNNDESVASLCADLCVSAAGSKRTSHKQLHI